MTRMTNREIARLIAIRHGYQDPAAIEFRRRARWDERKELADGVSAGFSTQPMITFPDFRLDLDTSEVGLLRVDQIPYSLASCSDIAASKGLPNSKIALLVEELYLFLVDGIERFQAGGVIVVAVEIGSVIFDRSLDDVAFRPRRLMLSVCVIHSSCTRTDSIAPDVQLHSDADVAPLQQRVPSRRSGRSGQVPAPFR